MAMDETALIAILEVIERTGDCADDHSTAVLMARGWIVESKGRLVVTRSGRLALRVAGRINGDPDERDPCPMGCGGTTEDVYGGPCAACWRVTDGQ